MSTFLEICQETRKLAGLQGTGPASVIGATGLEAVLVKHVKDSYTNLQNFRTEWRWLRLTADFLIDQGESTKTVAQILGSPNRFRKWMKDVAYAYISGQWVPMIYVPYDTFIRRTINQSGDTQPTFFTIQESDNTILVPTTDAQYNIRVDYTKSPQILATNAEVPEMPSYFHNIITFSAVEALSTHVGNPEVADEYFNKYTTLLKALMREQLPKKNFNVRGIA